MPRNSTPQTFGCGTRIGESRQDLLSVDDEIRIYVLQVISLSADIEMSNAINFYVIPHSHNSLHCSAGINNRVLILP